MAINVQRIALIHEKLHFLNCSVRGVHYHLINVLGPFSIILQPRNFYKVKFAYISSARETARKITKILQYFGFYLEFESFRSVKYS